MSKLTRLVCGAAWCLAQPAMLLAGDPPASGAAVYERLGCAACHAIAGKGNRRNPLDGVGSRLDAATLRKWIVEPTTMKAGVRKPAYDKTPAADLDALVEYLLALHAPVP